MNEKNLMNDKIVAGKLKGVSFVNPECLGMVVLWIHRGEYGLKHTTIYSCKLVAFLLAANEKKGILDFIYLIQPRANQNIAHLCCIWLYCWLPIWGFSMWWCCLYPFFMRPNCKWSALVSGDKLWPIWKERRLGIGLIVGLNCWDLLFTWVGLNEKFLVFARRGWLEPNDIDF